MASLKEEIEKRRTFAIISHPDAGKTTFSLIALICWSSRLRGCGQRALALECVAIIGLVLASMHDSCRRLYEQQFSNESYVATLTRLVKELTDGEE